mmetsp:Transcript_58070/g.64914  ORF Transcript_58070/g.64914 Transcript_58070/m.64914 type:complete len:180 (-) Transcript_58070:839-1378(-)
MVALTTAAKNSEPLAYNLREVVENLKKAIFYLCAHRSRNAPLDFYKQRSDGRRKQEYFDRWNKSRCELRQFQDENNHLSVPTSHKTLYTWVLTQRQAYNEGTLLIERQIILEEMDFVLNPYESLWSKRLASLTEFQKEHGHTIVSSKKGVLGRWVLKTQTDQRITLLNNLDFVWNAYSC